MTAAKKKDMKPKKGMPGYTTSHLKPKKKKTY